MSSLPGMGGSLARLLLLPIALATLGAGVLPAEEKKEKEKFALAPDVEEKLAEFLKKAGEAKRKVWATRMKQEIERMTKAAGLSAEEAKALEAPAELAAEACVPGWTEKIGDVYRPYLASSDERGIEIDQLFSQVDQVAQSDHYGDYVRPYEHPKWDGEIRRVLSAEKAAAWEKARTEHREIVKKEAAEVLKATVEATSQQQRAVLAGKGATIKTLLALPKERVEKIEALAKTVADAGAETLRRRGERMLLGMDDVQRKQIIKQRRFYVNPDEKESEAQLAAWQEGLAGVLSAEEKKQLQEKRETSTAKRIVVFGKIMLTFLDDRIAFTESQRERLQPIAERLVKAQDALFKEASDESSDRINSQLFFMAGARATEDELKAILDPHQCRHWEEACLPKNIRASQGMVTIRKAEPAGAAKPPARPPEPEDLENVLSDYLYEKALDGRKHLQPFNLLKAEDAARVAGLSPEVLGRLETAARGVTEATLASWKTNTEQTIRSQVQDATPENIKQRLASIGSYSYQRMAPSASADAPLWEKAVNAELTGPQLAAWKKELDARTAYRERAIVALIMAEFDSRVSLNPEQWTRLEPIIAGNVKDYTPDIESMFSHNYPYSWYLLSYSMFIPIAAIPETDLKAILSKEQWDTWNTRPELENTSNYWENVRSRHEQRKKEVKK